jgi:hypothetical protein
MPIIKLIGKDDATASRGYWANYLEADLFQCSTSGFCSEFRLKVTGNINIKAAIYSDNSGTPHVRLAKKDSGTVCTTGWNTITFESPVDLVAGTYYWLIVCADSDYGGYVSVTGNGHKFASKTYSGYSFPTTINESWTTYNSITSLFAGWGSTSLTIIPSSTSQSVGYGQPKLNLVLKPSGTAQSQSIGQPELNLVLKPSGIAQAQSVGTPAVVTSVPLIYPPGIAQAVGIGTPSLIYPQVILPPGIDQPVASGEPWLGIFGYVRPVGVEQQISIGSPTLYKYVWHVVLDGRYNIESPEVNRSYIIGRDQYGNPVYGTAVDSTELDLVGERLDFQQELAIPTESQAASMASAILSKMRLTGKSGVILITPNCGQELFDVVQISDSGANQHAVSFRVVGIRFEYNPKRAVYQHILFLAAP